MRTSILGVMVARRETAAGDRHRSGMACGRQAGLRGLGTGTELLVIKPVFNLLVVVYAYVHSLPLALVIVTLAFQLCLLPMVRLQPRATRALRSLQPQLQQLHEQYH